MDKWDKKTGFATFVADQAQIAFMLGEDMSKERHKEDGIIKSYNGISWVFSNNNDNPEKEVISCYKTDK